MDPGHNTFNLTANQLIQFALAVGFQVTLAFYGLLHDLLVRSRAVSGLGLRGPPRKSPSASAIGSARGDSVASQSRFLLPTMTGLIANSACASVPDTRQTSVLEPCVFQQGNAAEVPDLEDVPLANVVSAARTEEGEGKKRVLIHASCLVREGRTQLLDVVAIKGGWCLPNRCLKMSHGFRSLLQGPKVCSIISESSFLMICARVSNRSRGIYEIKRHYQSPNHLRQDQSYREKCCPDAVREKDTRVLHGKRLVAE